MENVFHVIEGSNHGGFMTTISSINFCGTPVEQPVQVQYGTSQVTNTNFKAQADTYNGKTKKSHPGRTFFGLVALAALAIAGMGYSHKAGWVNKLGEGKFKNFSETVTNKCHEWCAWTKGTCVKGWDKVKNLFTKKKD